MTEPVILSELKEKKLISKEGMPAEADKIKVKEEYDLDDKEIYTVIFTVLNNKGEQLEERSIMYSNYEDELGNPVNNYDTCKAVSEQGRIDKVTTDYGWDK